jgi:membrane-associated phospholipid phosphatase
VTDIIPNNSNRVAYYVGLLFHPFVVAVPTLFIVLSEIPANEVLKWVALVISVFMVPVAMSLFFLRLRGKYIYQRRERLRIYIVGWVSILLCLVLTIALHAPAVLVACVAALALWIPLQFGINTWLTMISIHTAVITGCVVGLLMLGKLPSPLLQGLGLAVIVATAWARITTRNHTMTQVILGVFVGALPVLLVFPLVLQ